MTKHSGLVIRVRSLIRHSGFVIRHSVLQTGDELPTAQLRPRGPATALAMGMPALVREGMTWKDLRLRALHATPVELRAVGRRGDAAEVEA